jgi:hypothetical protein
MPWFGLPGNNFTIIIQSKVAFIDLVLSNLSVKLDMITDLLVIIDSVKSNVDLQCLQQHIFHIYFRPALRRPGRFDETISIL